MVVQRVFALHIEPGGHVLHAHFSRSPTSCRYSWPILQVPQGGFSHAVCISFEVLPAGHLEHCCWPRVSWYCSSGQATHLPAVAPNLPRSQPEQTTLAAVVEYLPISQLKHLSGSSLGPRYLPSPHSSQEVPALPGIQSVQVALPLIEF